MVLRSQRESILTLAHKSFADVAAQFGLGRTGGFIHIVHSDGRALDHSCIGNPAVEKWDAYQDLSREKNVRMLKSVYPASWFTRDVSKHQYGGAILTDVGLAISFSGLPEIVDQAFVLAIARCLSLIDDKTADRIVAQSRTTKPDAAEIHDAVYNTVRTYQ